MDTFRQIGPDFVFGAGLSFFSRDHEPEVEGRRRRLSAEITASKSAILHLVCVIIMYTIYVMYKDALAWPTVLRCRHSREVTIGPVACLSKEYLAQWLYERLQRFRSPNHTFYLTDPHPAISFTKAEACGNSGQLFE